MVRRVRCRCVSPTRRHSVHPHGPAIVSHIVPWTSKSVSRHSISLSIHTARSPPANRCACAAAPAKSLHPHPQCMHPSHVPMICRPSKPCACSCVRLGHGTCVMWDCWRRCHQSIPGPSMLPSHPSVCVSRLCSPLPRRSQPITSAAQKIDRLMTSSLARFRAAWCHMFKSSISFHQNVIPRIG